VAESVRPPEVTRPVSLMQLFFTYADTTDCLLMLVGTLGGIVTVRSCRVWRKPGAAPGLAEMTPEIVSPPSGDPLRRPFQVEDRL
jgi:hypothetical protein